MLFNHCQIGFFVPLKGQNLRRAGRRAARRLVRAAAAGGGRAERPGEGGLRPAAAGASRHPGRRGAEGAFPSSHIWRI